MSFLDGLLYQTGQFAKLCDTTKETLRHYRNIGLLVPAQTGKNGYKLYSASQLAEYSFITLMRSLGCSLEEVAELMALNDEETLIAALERKRLEVEHRRRELDRTERLLDHAIRNLSWQPEAAAGTLVSRQADRFICTRMEGLEAHDIEDAQAQTTESLTGGAVQALFKHMSYCNENALGDFLPTTYRFTIEAAATGAYDSGTWICTQLGSNEEPPKRPSASAESTGDDEEMPEVHERPAGDYLVFDQELDITALIKSVETGNAVADPFATALHALEVQANSLGKRLVGDLYVEEISSLRPSLEQRIALETLVRVE